MLIHDYIIDQQGFDWLKLLENWYWLLPERFVVWLMSRIGDLFIVFDDGTVHMLDIGAGSLTQVADSREDFTVKIDQDDNANRWLIIPLVDQLVATGMTLSQGQCYGFRVPPVLGGKYEVGNIAVLPIHDFIGAYGLIHQQIKDVPNGGKVIFKVTNGE